MPFKSFSVPVFHGEWAERELNQFLKTHRVLHVEQRWVDQGSNSFWAVWVDYVEASAPAANGPSAAGAKKKVDYKDRLSSEDFDVYLQLRSLRKEMAAEEGVALYAVFTNDQLAQVSEQRPRSKPELLKISGVGEGRADKYGPRMFQLLNEVAKVKHETSGQAAGKDR